MVAKLMRGSLGKFSLKGIEIFLLIFKHQLCKNKPLRVKINLYGGAALKIGQKLKCKDAY